MKSGSQGTLDVCFKAVELKSPTLTIVIRGIKYVHLVSVTFHFLFIREMLQRSPELV